MIKSKVEQSYRQNGIKIRTTVSDVFPRLIPDDGVLKNTRILNRQQTSLNVLVTHIQEKNRVCIFTFLMLK